MYTIEITPEEWELVYSACRAGPDSHGWAKALVGAPLWGDGVDELSEENTRILCGAFAGDVVAGRNAFEGLDRNTLLFFKLNQLWTDFDVDRAEKQEQENG